MGFVWFGLDVFSSLWLVWWGFFLFRLGWVDFQRVFLVGFFGFWLVFGVFLFCFVGFGFFFTFFGKLNQHF